LFLVERDGRRRIVEANLNDRAHAIGKV
jgi:hypothetical protein